MTEKQSASSGISQLDAIVQNLRLGDNVVWQVDDLEDYKYFAQHFIRQAIKDGRKCVYLRFAPHEPVLADTEAVEVIEVAPGEGFDRFCSEVDRIIQEKGTGVFYVMDNLSNLVDEWASDEQLANFFQITCPHLYELDTIAYFALLRGRHDYAAIARIRETTQLLLDVYQARGGIYLHPLKVYGRYSPQMFLPHLVSQDEWQPVLYSGEAAAVAAPAHRHVQRIVAHSIAPWESVYRRLVDFQQHGLEDDETDPELHALKDELSRMLFGVHPEFERLANRYFRLKDLLTIRNRMIGSGRVGGKAAGMLLARRILQNSRSEVDFSRVLEDHDSFFIGSDVFFTFLVNNELFRLRLQLARSGELSREKFEDVERRFMEGSFPAEIMERFREMLEYFGQAPIIVRSSSFLEDSFGNAFAGKYRSEFCPNQGTPEQRLEEFVKAVKLVYASALNPDALTYRQKRGLSNNDEQMAILVQRVSGMPHKNRYFFPILAGVAFSRNLYAWNDRIDPNKGMVRLVYGLGTRAVNRVSGDYTRMIAVSHPQLRPESGMAVMKYSQRWADVLDLRDNEMKTLLVQDLLSEQTPSFPMLVSLECDGYLQEPIGHVFDLKEKRAVLTFNNLITITDFVKVADEMLSQLEHAYEHPVDIEFTAFIAPDGHVRMNLLQCRPMWLPGSPGTVTLPDDISKEHTLFRANRLICGGKTKNIRHILYIDPRRYAETRDADLKGTAGRIVGKLNRIFANFENPVLMMGPGRWGSSNMYLGVNVGYADIDNAAVLVELAFEQAGHVPEVSYGTHFFQDLVEAHIIYLPVYPDEQSTEFNFEFFSRSTNVLTSLLPEAAEFADMIHVIDVPASTGMHAHVSADPRTRRAICYLR